MSKLVEELKKEHKTITGVLSKVNALGITNPEAQKMLFEVRNLLLAHLKKEDELLYPVLRKAAKRNSELYYTLDDFAKDMESISREVLNFFEKYGEGGLDFELGKDFSHLFSRLSMRILKEEKILCAKYDEIVKE